MTSQDSTKEAHGRSSEIHEEHDIPETRENYVDVAYMGTPPVELSEEEESMLPDQFQTWNVE